jgi:7-cyano-7-deazaguanine synthase in queuosine biosynthesis
MTEPRLVLCSGATVGARDARREGRKILELDALGHSANVNLRLEDVAGTFLKQLSPRLVDLLEIATYVYTADASTSRAGRWIDDAVESWRRDFRMVIPVRDFAFWDDTEIRELVRRALEFLSDDQYTLDFVKMKGDRASQEYLQIGMEDWPIKTAPRVCLFSGGLDSLAGAVEMASRGEPLVLVSHRSVATVDRRQRDLVAEIRRMYPRNQMLHIPVWVNKSSRLAREYSQRTRSFLFAALGCAVAKAIDADGVRFFENGVVSLNLPVADEVVGARASRTTHPHALAMFGELLGKVLGRSKATPFVVDNPYLRLTKTEVVERIVAVGASSLIESSCSCAHTIHKSRSQWHCGTCSQCIDRRIAVLAAGQRAADPERDYAVNVFVGERKEGYEQNIAIDYARHAFELAAMDEETIGAKFSRELAAAVRSEDRRAEAASALVETHARHAKTVVRVITEQVGEHAADLVAGRIAKTSMLNLVVGGRHLAPIWQRYAARIGEVIASAIPVMAAKSRPANELRLQEWCDGALKGHDPELRREYPLLRWASVGTKPDWSSESLGLWVELKYLRVPGDRTKVTDAIAADITKYTGRKRHILFIIYDPDGLLGEPLEVLRDIERHEGVFSRIVR